MPLQKSHSVSSLKRSSSSKKLRNSTSHALHRNRRRTLQVNKQVPAAPPTIACFMSAIGETQQEESLSSRNVANLMDRDVLRLSSKWSRAVSQNDLLNTGICCPNELSSSTNFYEYERTLSSECAKLEVEAIASMVSLTSSTDNSRRGGEINESWDDFETDEIDEEEEKLNIFAEHLNCDFRQLMIDPAEGIIISR